MGREERKPKAFLGRAQRQAPVCSWHWSFRSGFGLRLVGFVQERRKPGVEPALLFLVLLPPPSTGTLGLAGRYGAGARLTADRQDAAVMKGVVGNVSVAHEAGYSVAGPIRQRDYLGKMMSHVMSGAGDQSESRI